MYRYFPPQIIFQISNDAKKEATFLRLLSFERICIVHFFKTRIRSPSQIVFCIINMHNNFPNHIQLLQPQRERRQNCHKDSCFKHVTTERFGRAKTVRTQSIQMQSNMPYRIPERINQAHLMRLTSIETLIMSLLSR